MSANDFETEPSSPAIVAGVVYRHTPNNIKSLPYYLITRFKEDVKKLTCYTQLPQHMKSHNIFKQYPLPVRAVANSTRTFFSPGSPDLNIERLTSLLDTYVNEKSYKELTLLKKNEFIERLLHTLSASMSHIRNGSPIKYFYGLGFGLKVIATSGDKNRAVTQNGSISFPDNFVIDVIIEHAVHAVATEFNVQTDVAFDYGQQQQLNQELAEAQELFKSALYRFICGVVIYDYQSTNLDQSDLTEILSILVKQISFDACFKKLLNPQEPWIYSTCIELLKASKGLNQDFLISLLEIIDNKKLYLNEADWQKNVTLLTQPPAPVCDEKRAGSANLSKELSSSSNNLSTRRNSM